MYIYGGREREREELVCSSHVDEVGFIHYATWVCHLIYKFWELNYVYSKCLFLCYNLFFLNAF